MHDSRQVLLRHLVERRAITDADIAGAHSHASERQACLIQSLVQTGRLAHRDLALARARVSSVPYVNLDRYAVERANASLLPKAVADRYTAFPVFVVDGVASVAMLDPLDLTAIEALRVATHHEIEPVVCEEDALRALIAEAYRPLEKPEQPRDATGAGPDPQSTQAPSAPAGEAQAPAHDPIHGDRPLAERTIRDAIVAGATAVHIFSDDLAAPLRLRIGGTLKRIGCDASDPEARLLTDQIKALAGIDAARVRAPQRGRFRLALASGPIDATVSVLPTAAGEDVCVRFQPARAAPLELHELGMPERIASFVTGAIARPAGLLLVTGHAGAGRSTTIAAALRARADERRCVLALTDHTAHGIAGVRRIEADQAAPMSHAGLIAAAAAHDPDVIAAGDLADASVAHAAFDAAARGCLVIATMQSISPHGAIERLRGCGIAPDQIETTLIGVLHQRLTRRACETCSGACGDSGRGCPECHATGFADPAVRFEALPVTPAIARIGADEAGYAAWTLRCAQARLGSIDDDRARRSA